MLFVSGEGVYYCILMVLIRNISHVQIFLFLQSSSYFYTIHNLYIQFINFQTINSKFHQNILINPLELIKDILYVPIFHYQWHKTIWTLNINTYFKFYHCQKTIWTLNINIKRYYKLYRSFMIFIFYIIVDRKMSIGEIGASQKMIRLVGILLMRFIFYILHNMSSRKDCI